MRHRKRGRKLGRNPNHQRALLRNLASALILTELREEDKENAPGTAPDFIKRLDSLTSPKVPGRIVTTLSKAKEVRPLVERCITIARRALPHQEAADRLEPDADRNSQEWQDWRHSNQWQQWNQTIAPVVTARRRALKLLGDKLAVWVLFEKIAPRMEDRNGGYTRVLRLANPRLGDSGPRAILEFVGTNDRKRAAAPKPSFVDDTPETAVEDVAPAKEEGAIEEEIVEKDALEQDVVEEEAGEKESPADETEEEDK